NLALIEREQDENAVVLAFLADAASMVLEQFVRVLPDVAVRFDRLHRGDDHDVARGVLERADHPIHLGGAARVDDMSEVVDRLGQLRQAVRSSGDGDGEQQRGDDRLQQPHRQCQPSTNVTSRSTASRYDGKMRSASVDEISVTRASRMTSDTMP